MNNNPSGKFRLEPTLIDVVVGLLGLILILAGLVISYRIVNAFLDALGTSLVAAATIAILTRHFLTVEKKDSVQIASGRRADLTSTLLG